MKPMPGDEVVLKGLPPGLLDGLPTEDQEAISEVVGRRVRLIEWDADGRAELEFTDKAGHIHYIYVSENYIQAAR
jgi:hypothetical protein